MSAKPSTLQKVTVEGVLARTGGLLPLISASSRAKSFNLLDSTINRSGYSTTNSSTGDKTAVQRELFLIKVSFTLRKWGTFLSLEANVWSQSSKYSRECFPTSTIYSMTCKAKLLLLSLITKLSSSGRSSTSAQPNWKMLAREETTRTSLPPSALVTNSSLSTLTIASVSGTWRQGS